MNWKAVVRHDGVALVVEVRGVETPEDGLDGVCLVAH